MVDRGVYSATHDTFAAWVKDRRTELGVSQAVLAKAICASSGRTYGQTQVERMEKGVSAPTIADLYAYAEALETDPHDVLQACMETVDGYVPITTYRPGQEAA